MRKTKLLTSICAFLFILSFVGCEESTSQDSFIEEETDFEEDIDSNEERTNPDDEKKKFVVWCPQEIVDITTTQIERYISQFEGTDNEFPYKLVVEYENNSFTKILNDVVGAAAIFFTSQNLLPRLIKSGSISAVPDSYANDVRTRNDPTTINLAAVSDTTLYAYPVSYDNGYFAYYNKSILSEDDLATQEGLIDALTAYNTENGTNYSVSFAIGSSGWYNAAYFFGAGCCSEWTTDNDDNFVDCYDTYNSIAGYDALEGMAQLMNSGVWYDNELASGFNQERGGNSAVVVSGTWDSDTAHQLLGDNFAATKLWTYTVPASTRAQYVEVDDEGAISDATYQLGSFSGCSFVGVRSNSNSEKLAWAHAIANYLTSEECQLERYYSNGWGPSNLKAQENEDVAADEVLQALFAQNKYATMQGDYPDVWWEATEMIGNRVKADNTSVLTKEQCESIFSDYSGRIAAILPNSWYAYAVIGSLNGCGFVTTPAACGYNQYALNYLNAENGTYYADNGIVHGEWIVPIDVIYGGITLSDGTRIGLVRVVDYQSLTGNYGYSELTSDIFGQEFEYDNNIAIKVESYSLAFDYTGNIPVITITQ